MHPPILGSAVQATRDTQLRKHAALTDVHSNVLQMLHAKTTYLAFQQ